MTREKCWTYMQFISKGDEFLKEKSAIDMKDYFEMKDICRNCNLKKECNNFLRKGEK